MSTAFGDMLAHAGVARLFGPAAVLQAMLDFEAALVQAQAELGMVEAGHARTIAACCHLDDTPPQALVDGAAVAGSLAIPLVLHLKDRVQRVDPQAVPSVHHGATSQDLIDTAFCLQARAALALIDADLARLLQAILRLRQTHGACPMLARTLMQPAAVSVLELRLLNWAQPLLRCRQRLTAQAHLALRLQLGGAVGTGAAWGAQTPQLQAAVARRLALPQVDGASWQVQRDELARLAAELGVLVGAVGKVAADVALMSQPEIGELQESAAAGRGGSSAMAHKRNPVGAMVALAAQQRAPQRVAAVLSAMAQSHERGLGHWQAEGAECADLFIIAASAVCAVSDGLQHATVDENRLRGHVQAFLQQQPQLPAALCHDDPAAAAARAAAWSELDRRLST